MSKKAANLPQKKISNLLRDRETEQYGTQHQKDEELQLYMQKVVRNIIASLKYQMEHKYLHITFSAIFDSNAENQQTKLIHTYYTSDQKTDNMCRVSTAPNVPDFQITQEDMEYLRIRIAETDSTIWKGFIKKRLECTEAGMFRTEKNGQIYYDIEIIYILGAQKDKPVGEHYKRPT